MTNHATQVRVLKQQASFRPDAYMNEGRTGPSTIIKAFELYGRRSATKKHTGYYDHKAG